MTATELIAQLQKLKGNEIVVIDGGDEVGFVKATDTISINTEFFPGNRACSPVVVISIEGGYQS